MGAPKAAGEDGLSDTLAIPDSLSLERLVSRRKLVEALDHGLQSDTLVAVFGEFGRSPKINKNGGRDHWGSCFSGVLAGAGIEGGQVIGASDRLGGYPSERPISGPELHATLLHRLGIDPNGLFRDRSGRPTPISETKPIRELV